MKKYWKICFTVGFSIFLLFLAIYYWNSVSRLLRLLIGAVSPLITGAAMAYAINIPMSFFERHYFPKTRNRLLLRSRRPVCMFSSVVLLLALISLVVSLVLPQLISSVKLIFTQLPGSIEDLIAIIDRFNILPDDIINMLEQVDWNSRIGTIISMLSSGITSVADALISAVTSVFSWLVTVFLSLIFALYVLGSKETLARQYHKVSSYYLREHWCHNINYLFHTLDDCFHKFIVGQCTEALILGILCTSGLLILRMPYATMIGTLVAFTALIPIAGAYIGAAVGAFMVLTVSPVKALVFLIFLVLLQQFEGNVIYPKVVGYSIGLPGIWVLTGVTVGGGLFGVIGMLIGVPITAAIYRLVREDVNGRSRFTGSGKLSDAGDPPQSVVVPASTAPPPTPTPAPAPSGKTRRGGSKRKR